MTIYVHYLVLYKVFLKSYLLLMYAFLLVLTFSLRKIQNGGVLVINILHPQLHPSLKIARKLTSDGFSYQIEKNARIQFPGLWCKQKFVIMARFLEK